MKRLVKEQIVLTAKDIRATYLYKMLNTVAWIYGILTIFNQIFGWTWFYNIMSLLIVVSISFIYTLYSNRRLKKIQFNVNDTKIKVLFGDLFKQKGVIAIPVNNYLDAEIGKRVAPTSLHGIFIEKVASGKKHFEQHINDFLRKNNNHLSTVRSTGLFPGYTLNIDVNENTYLLSVLSKTDNTNDMAIADITDLISSIVGMLNKARECSNNRPVNIPLFGGGLSKVGLNPQQLLNILMIIIIRLSQERRISSEIKVILSDKIFDEISLKPILEGVKYGI